MCSFFLLKGFAHQLGCSTFKDGLRPGFSVVFSAGDGRSSVEAWYFSALDLAESLSGAVDSDVHIFLADVVKRFDTVDGEICGLYSQPSGVARMVSA